MKRDAFQRGWSFATTLLLLVATFSASLPKAVAQYDYHFCADDWHYTPCTNQITCTAQGLTYFCSNYFAPGTCDTTPVYDICGMYLLYPCGMGKLCSTGGFVGSDCGERVDKCYS